MWYFILKVVISAGVVVAVSELAKGKTLWAGLLASLPLTSLLAMIWLYTETKDTQKISELSWSILGLVFPSLIFLVALPLLLKKLAFVPSLLGAVGIMLACYGLMLWLLKTLGVGDGV